MKAFRLRKIHRVLGTPIWAALSTGYSSAIFDIGMPQKMLISLFISRRKTYFMSFYIKGVVDYSRSRNAARN